MHIQDMENIINLKKLHLQKKLKVVHNPQVAVQAIIGIQANIKKSSVDSSPNKNYQSDPNNQKDSNNYAFEKTASDNEKTDDENISQTNTTFVNNMSNTMPEHQNTLLTAENIFILFAIFILGFGIVILADKFRNR